MRFEVGRNIISGAQLVEVSDKRGLVATITSTPDGSLKIVSKYATGKATETPGTPDRTDKGEFVRAIVVQLAAKPQK